MKRETIRIEFESDVSTLRFFVGDDPVTNVEWDLRKEARVEPEDLERRLGYAILGMISVIVGHSVGSRDYLTDRNNRSMLYLDFLRTRLEGGEHSAIVSMVLQLVGSARRNCDIGDIEKAEALLRDAALKGNPSAIEYLSSDWLAQRDYAIKAIKKGQSQ